MTGLTGVRSVRGFGECMNTGRGCLYNHHLIVVEYVSIRVA